MKKLLVLLLFAFDVFADDPIVIAHRGASGYLPEHTLAAKAMAVAQGADYVEQDVVMTKDDHLIVLHDLYLDRVTDVAKRFPKRARSDGHFYVIDFTLAEIQSLNLTDGFKTEQGEQQAIYPNRFPLWQSSFRIHTLAEEIELIQGLNHSMSKQVGIYPEIKSPWFFRREGKDISLAVLRLLKSYGYQTKQSLVYLQSFDANELRRIRFELMPALKIELPLVQLIAETDWQETQVLQDGQWKNYSYEWMFQPGGLELIASYAEGVGPWYPMLLKTNPETSKIKGIAWHEEAKRLGLLVHAYTFRSDPGQVPSAYSSFAEYINFYRFSIGIDGFFTDYPDKVKQVIQQSNQGNETSP